MKKFAWKFTLSLVLFLSIIAVCYSQKEWSVPIAQYIRVHLTEGYSSQTLLNWYNQHFQGFPVIIPTYYEHQDDHPLTVSKWTTTFVPPIKGVTSSVFDSTSKGVIFHLQQDAGIHAIASGQVIYVNRTSDSFPTVMIRHTDGIESVYGGLDKMTVEVNDYVHVGQRIGSSESKWMYFAVLQNKLPINPLDVVAFE